MGIGTVGDDAALLRDGFVKPDEMRAVIRAGAVGEIVGWAYNAQGELIEGLTNDRVLSVPLSRPATRKVIGVAMAKSRFTAIKGALSGKLINGLITNEADGQNVAPLIRFGRLLEIGAKAQQRFNAVFCHINLNFKK